MKRILMAGALVAFAAAPAAAQWAGMPVWNSPKGGTGITISGDFGSNNNEANGGNAFGARASVGLANLTVSAGVVTWDSDLITDKLTSFGATAAFRVIGGSLLPVGLNVQVGAGRSAEAAAGAMPALTLVNASVGLSASLPTPGISIEPYFSPGIRYYKASSPPPGFPENDTNFGFTVGANLNLGLFGIHLAYDSENKGSGRTAGILGVGAHVQLRVPMGM
jgi:hypothetical protein